LAKDVAWTVKGMDLLQDGFPARYRSAVAAHPSAKGIRIARLRLPDTDPRIDQAVDDALTKAGFQVSTLGDDFVKEWEQATKDGNAVAATGAWLSDHSYRYAPGVTTRTKSAILAGRITNRTSYRPALERRAAWRKKLSDTLRTVDFIALPTLKKTPLSISLNLKIGTLEARVLRMQNTVAVNFAGNPALALPIPLHHGPVPVTSLQLIAANRAEADLLNAGRLVEEAVNRK
jgi:amidase